MTTLTKVFVGVDISKNNLDVFIYPTGERLKVSNSEEEIKKFIKQMSSYKVKRIACEATGGYEKLLVKLSQKKSYNCWVIDPRRIKSFIAASGCKAKTDKIDAQKIAEFAAINSPNYEIIKKTGNEELLQSLVNRKADLTQYLASEKTRLKSPAHDLYIPSIETMISFFEKQIDEIEKKIEKIIAKDKSLSHRAKLLESIPGIGKATAALLVASVPELGQISNKKISALIGLCPYDRESGKYKGKKFIRGGRKVPRNALYMCALTAIQYNKPLKEFYNRLIANNKPFKVAMVAVMRKLIIIANSILKKGELCKV